MKNLTWHKGHISRKSRLELLGFENKVIWFTGLSGSGKSSIAMELEKILFEKNMVSFVLDGDNVRHGLNSDLGFSPKDRKENIRRIAEVAKLFYDSGIQVIVSFISPYKEDRKYARELVGKDFMEVFVKCSLEECERRDTKGLYKKARKGKIQDFTGISAPYEEPEHPEIIVDTENESIEESTKKVMDYIDTHASPFQQRPGPQ